MLTVKRKPEFGMLGGEVVIEITVDREIAEYLMDVMYEETRRTAEQGVNKGLGDAGSREFYAELSKALGEGS